MATKFITITIERLHDTNLNYPQKFLLSEIEQLTTLDKGCIASNAHFAELLGLTKTSVSRYISDLQSKGYISVQIINGTRNHVRIISINTPIQKQQDPLYNLVQPPYTKLYNPPIQSCIETKENKTINKTTTTKSTRSRSNKREDLKSFKKNFINNYQGQTFTTHSLGWEKTTQFTLDENNFIFNTVSHRTISKEDSLLIWTHLYQESLKAS